MDTKPTLQEIHAILTTAYGAVAALYGHLPPEISVSSAFAIGEACGVLSKAKAMIGRDVDDIQTDKKA